MDGIYRIYFGSRRSHLANCDMFLKLLYATKINFQAYSPCNWVKYIIHLWYDTYNIYHTITRNTNIYKDTHRYTFTYNYILYNTKYQHFQTSTMCILMSLDFYSYFHKTQKRYEAYYLVNSISWIIKFILFFFI